MTFEYSKTDHVIPVIVFSLFDPTKWLWTRTEMEGRTIIVPTVLLLLLKEKIRQKEYTAEGGRQKRHETL